MIKLKVPEMSCGHCKSAIEKAIASVDADASVNVDIEGRTVEINSSADVDALMSAIKEEGYESSPA